MEGEGIHVYHASCILFACVNLQAKTWSEMQASYPAQTSNNVHNTDLEHNSSVSSVDMTITTCLASGTQCDVIHEHD